MGGLLWTQLAQAPLQIALASAVTAWLTDLARKSNVNASVDVVPEAVPDAAPASQPAPS